MIFAFSACHCAVEGAALLLQLGQLALERLLARLGGVVLLLAQRRQLDLELHRAALELVDLLGHRVDLDAQPRRGLVDEVDRLVGQEAVGDVAVAQRRRGDRRRVLDADLVMDLVALLQPAQDRDRVLDGRLVDLHRLKAPLERRVLLDVLAVLVERRRADRPQLAAGEHRLEQVGGVDGALRGARADDRVQLVEEQHDLPAGVLDLLQHGLQALLELAAVLRAGQQRADVQRDDAAVAQRLGDVAGDDALGEALDDRRLADAGLADEHGVVLRAPAEHLDDAADLVVAADDRVELAVVGLGGEVAAVALERLDGLLGRLVGHRTRAHLGERLQHAVVRRALRLQGAAGGAVVVGQREQHVLDGDEAVLQRAHLALGAAQGLQDLGRHRGLGLGAERRHLAERGLQIAAQGRRRDADLAEHGRDEAALLVEERGQKMQRSDLRVASRMSERERGLQRLLSLDREPVGLHGSQSSRLRFVAARVDVSDSLRHAASTGPEAEGEDDLSLTASTRLMRTLGAALMVAASLALGGCGDDDKDSSESSAKTTAGGAGTQSGLGSARYEALEAVYAAAVPLDQLDDDAPISEYNRVLENYGQKCRRSSTPRTACWPRTAASARSSPTCASSSRPPGHARTNRRSSSAARAFRGFASWCARSCARASATTAWSRPPSCRRRAGRRSSTPTLSYEVMRGYGRAFAYLERALTTASQADAAKADALMTQAEARSERLPDARQALADFRSGCD